MNFKLNKTRRTSRLAEQVLAAPQNKLVTAHFKTVTAVFEKLTIPCFNNDVKLLLIRENFRSTFVECKQLKSKVKLSMCLTKYHAMKTCPSS
jgi:hypothetical protein